MFEGKSPIATAAEGETLRALAWSELSGRLAAARDLRASLMPGEAEGEASFDALSARWIAAHMDGQHDVNPEPSSNGKSARPMAADAPPGSLAGATREK